eukprot:jgi/Phyca11/114078/e_gw1.25.328.1
MCLVRDWYPTFFASAIAPWLSSLITVAPTCSAPMSLSSSRIHTTSLMQSLSAMYSASVELRATVFWNVERQTTGAPHTMSIVPLTERLSSRLPAQSASE